MDEDSKLAAKISGGDFTAKEVKYHACRVKYQTQAESRFRKIQCTQQYHLPRNKLLA